MNYGEELAYWYLRFNGFFPISNFVVHRSSGIKRTSDVDVLAVLLTCPQFAGAGIRCRVFQN